MSTLVHHTLTIVYTGILLLGLAACGQTSHSVADASFVPTAPSESVISAPGIESY